MVNGKKKRAGRSYDLAAEEKFPREKSPFPISNHEAGEGRFLLSGTQEIRKRRRRGGLPPQ
jgi:hypothetical protein